MSGRKSNSEVQIETSQCANFLSRKEPYLKSHLAKLIIAESHKAVLHNGIAQTVCHIRRKYWIPWARQLVKGFIRRCYICRKHQGKTYEAPPIPSLPDFRVSETPPFYNTGLDFIGPLFTTKGSKVSKNYILPLTCCSTRAVHLEVCDNLTLQSFYMSFRRFAATRGLPRLLVSDNALTFKTASKEVSKIVRSTEEKDFLVNKGVDWKFITERASWMGGTWERLVQTVKRSIKKVIGHSSLNLNFEELDTLVTEVEAVVNERLLTYVYDDLEGAAYPLTPAQLIYGRNLATFNDKHFEICSTNATLTRRAKNHKQLLRQFTFRWKTEYLQGLQEIKTNERQNQPDFNVGDIVILKDVNTPRQFWKLAKIEEFIDSSDRVVRSVVICVAGKDGKRKLAVQHLVPLEIRSEPVREVDVYKENDNDNNLNNLDDQSCGKERRPKRNAAIIGEILRKGNS